MRTVANPIVLPEIPDKRYFTIGEVSVLCAVKPHVLRYWEQEFRQLHPVKRRGNRRYYQQNDIALIRHIRSLLYEQGFTITGARQQLRDSAREIPAANDALASAPNGAGSNRRKALAEIRDELERLLRNWPE